MKWYVGQVVHLTLRAGVSPTLRSARGKLIFKCSFKLWAPPLCAVLMTSCMQTTIISVWIMYN